MVTSCIFNPLGMINLDGEEYDWVIKRVDARFLQEILYYNFCIFSNTLLYNDLLILNNFTSSNAKLQFHLHSTSSTFFDIWIIIPNTPHFINEFNLSILHFPFWPFIFMLTFLHNSWFEIFIIPHDVKGHLKVR